jgi:D-alanine-D-alanine ligase
MTASSPRLRVVVLFGGRSSEHDVSVMSATNVMRALSPERYDAVPVYVTRDGRWLASRFEDGVLTRPANGDELCLVPGGRGRMLAIPAGAAPHELPAIGALFPVLHGLDGEDGSVQGLAAVCGVPLVGCGILGSAASLDKDVAKRLLMQAGVATARSLTVHAADAPSFAAVEAALGLPVFVKPARQGSSVGVSKAATESEYRAALAEGFRHDRKLLVEAFIDGREIECAVLEAPDGSLFVSRPGEIVPAEAHGFYTYDAKYTDAAGAAILVPAALPDDVEARLRDIAAQAFRALGCDGLARVDFFVTADGRLLVNEINTMPGFTDISMYPKAMAASGVDGPALVDRLVAHGLARGSRDA